MGVPELRSEADAVVGRYVVAFADLCWTMRHGLVRVGHVAGQSARTIRSIADELPASRLADAFFTTCIAISDFTPEELEITEDLRRQVQRAIDERDSRLNGDWWAGWTGRETALGKPMPAWFRDERKRVALAELRRGCADLVHVRGLLDEFIEIAAGYAHEVGSRERIRLSDVGPALRSGAPVVPSQRLPSTP